MVDTSKIASPTVSPTPVREVLRLVKKDLWTMAGYLVVGAFVWLGLAAVVVYATGASWALILAVFASLDCVGRNAAKNFAQHLAERGG